MAFWKGRAEQRKLPGYDITRQLTLLGSLQPTRSPLL